MALKGFHASNCSDKSSLSFTEHILYVWHLPLMWCHALTSESHKMDFIISNICIYNKARTTLQPVAVIWRDIPPGSVLSLCLSTIPTEDALLIYATKINTNMFTLMCVLKRHWGLKSQFVNFVYLALSCKSKFPYEIIFYPA